MLRQKAKDHSICKEIPADVLWREKIRSDAVAGIVLHIAINPVIDTNKTNNKKKQKTTSKQTQKIDRLKVNIQRYID